MNFFKFLLIGCFFFIAFIACKKTETITNTVTVKDTVLVRSIDTTFSMNARAWNCFSYQTLSLLDTGATTYQTTTEGVKFMAQAFRRGSRLQLKNEVGFVNKTVYFKWKGFGAGSFCDFVPQIKYDPNTNDGIPTIQGVDLGLFCVNGSLSGFVTVPDNTWCYTRISPITGTDNYRITTATGNYDNQGGTIIANNIMPIYTKSGYIAIRIGDAFGGTNVYGILGACRIASN
jgi:hypothetical protein